MEIGDILPKYRAALLREGLRRKGTCKQVTPPKLVYKRNPTRPRPASYLPKPPPPTSKFCCDSLPKSHQTIPIPLTSTTTSLTYLSSHSNNLLLLSLNHRVRVPSLSKTQSSSENSHAKFSRWFRPKKPRKRALAKLTRLPNAPNPKISSSYRIKRRLNSSVSLGKTI